MKHLKRIFENTENDDLIDVESAFSFFISDGICKVNQNNASFDVVINFDEEEEIDTKDIDNFEDFNEILKLSDKMNQAVKKLKNSLVRLEKLGFSWVLKELTVSNIHLSVMKIEKEYELKDAFIGIDRYGKHLAPNYGILKKVLSEKYNLTLLNLYEGKSYSSDSNRWHFSIKTNWDDPNFIKLHNDLKKVMSCNIRTYNYDREDDVPDIRLVVEILFIKNLD